MSYVIKVGKRFDHSDSGVGGVQIDPDQTRVVATLDEAQSITWREIIDHCGAANKLPTNEANRQWHALFPTAVAFEPGAAIGPLPDGTVIKVEEQAA